MSPIVKDYCNRQRTEDRRRRRLADFGEWVLVLLEDGEHVDEWPDVIQEQADQRDILR